MQVDDDSFRLARLNRELYSATRSSHRWYNKTRSLEAAIRRHVNRECGCESPGECLAVLARLVPRRPRPTLTEIAAGRRVKA